MNRYINEGSHESIEPAERTSGHPPRRLQGRNQTLETQSCHGKRISPCRSTQSRTFKNDASHLHQSNSILDMTFSYKNIDSRGSGRRMIGQSSVMFNAYER
ncbi:hypothetical protein WG66_005857 [Moniliophthora roreri]|nr:hypothetical protein WG66_005857 [Moniliophthora roreri]